MDGLNNEMGSKNMGVDISGGMIVGCDLNKVSIDNEDVHEWIESNGMEIFSKWYDADSDGMVLGFFVPDVDPLSDDFYDWVKQAKLLAVKFNKLTGGKAELIGMQNVW